MNKEEDFTFCTTLIEVLECSRPIDALFEHPVYRRRGLTICRGFEHNPAKAEELFQEVSLKVWLKILGGFTPDRSQKHCKFFAWFRKIAQNTFFSELRKPTPQIDEKPVEDHYSVADSSPDAEEQLMLRERGEQITERVRSLPKRLRLATTLFLNGFSLRESEEILNGLGIKCCHMTIRNWQRKGLATFFPEDVSPVKRASGF